MSPNIRFRRTLLLCKASHFAQLPKCPGLCANKSVTSLRSRVAPSFPRVSYHKGCAYSRCFFSTRSSDVCPIFSCEVLLKCSLFYWKPTSSTIQKPSQILLVKVFPFPCVPVKYDCLSIITPTCARVTFDYPFLQKDCEPVVGRAHVLFNSTSLPQRRAQHLVHRRYLTTIYWSVFLLMSECSAGT